MDSRQQRGWDSIQNSLVTLNMSIFDCREVVAGRATLEKAAKVIAELEQAQATDRRAGVDGLRIQSLRSELRRMLLRISRHGDVVLEGLPGIEDDLRVPHTNAKTVDLLDAAARIVKNARPHAKSLYTAGLPKDFLKRVETTAKALAAKSTSTDTALNRRSRATRSIPAALRRGRRIMKAIDSTIRSEFADDPVALTLWDSAKRIPGRIGRPKKKRRKPPETNPS
jgi:hypothetical protein